MLFGLALNILLCFAFYFGLDQHHNFMPKLHTTLVIISQGLLVILMPTFLLCVVLEPGKLKQKYDFIWLTAKLLNGGLHLDNLCVYDEVLKSETSFHCTMCNRCVEMFDHHCPYINNCLGRRNLKYFLIFLFSYTFFMIILLLECCRHLYEGFYRDGIGAIH